MNLKTHSEFVASFEGFIDPKFMGMELACFSLNCVLHLAYITTVSSTEMPHSYYEPSLAQRIEFVGRQLASFPTRASLSTGATTQYVSDRYGSTFHSHHHLQRPHGLATKHLPFTSTRCPVFPQVKSRYFRQALVCQRISMHGLE